MNIRTSTRLVIAAAALAGALFSGAVSARDHQVTVAQHVSTAGLDLNRLADARTFYTRLENAAWVVCTRGNRVNLAPIDDFKGCYEKALGSAVRTSAAPLITELYLTTHTYAEAAARGIAIPTQVARR